MVFVSFEGFLDAVPSASSHHDHHHPPPADDTPSLEVVVTPGSPPKHSVNTSRSPLKAMDANYVVFVQDNAVTASTYALRKSHVQIAALHDNVRRCILEHPCTTFACCGPLRRLASARPPAIKSRFFDLSSDLKVDAVVTQRTWVVETFVNDLLDATTGRDLDCAAVGAARHALHLFLDIPSRRHVHVTHALHQLKQPQRTPRTNQNHSSNAHKLCSICLDPATPSPRHMLEPDMPVGLCDNVCSSVDNRVVVTLGCGHVFHEHCVHPWLLSHFACPVCRTSLTSSC
ncbi:hypothetical protein H257_11180 [Aphanomyces astaci]|uniref:RING-type domain-containing protein n=1 Tax=Aphanomyces astaci TaxID=112090 RepID=W4G3H1_APHAT|nr:hypothetical protein H257_11180 [Aphanomyces astaci]ETV74235.1 hypothetical protein H257_11180 [Aphanomyces astaci]RQM29661.1 hypothetical protein B5M09_003777 [Aphanomyces astaci]|eukprot:XP_009836341.1 hypothetical protein H257_11180 [Aphanomyces astaci]